MTIFTEVGAALTAWECVENTLTRLFAATTGLNELFALKIYGSLPSSASKQAIIRAAGKARFGGLPPFMDLFSKTMDLAEKFLPRRNDIAHGIAWLEDNGYFLEPPYHLWKSYDYIDFEHKYAFTSEDIARYREWFIILNVEINNSITLLAHVGDVPTLRETPLTRYLQPSRSALQKIRSRAEPPPLPEPYPL